MATITAQHLKAGMEANTPRILELLNKADQPNIDAGTFRQTMNDLGMAIYGPITTEIERKASKPKQRLAIQA